MLDESKTIDTPAGVRVRAAAPGNHLLRALGQDDLDLLAPDRRQEPVMPGQILLEPRDVPEDAFFPVEGTVLSILAVTADRKPVETTMIGAEGAVGALFGPQAAAYGFRVQVLTGGAVLRVPAARLGAALDASPPLRAQMGRYVAALLGQVRIGVACAALHTVEARAARWMLDLQDRLGDRSLPLTQEALADLLGVRRTTITRVVAALEARGLVRHRRGRIIVMDRTGLERASCECHALAHDQFDALTPDLYPRAAATA